MEKGEFNGKPLLRLLFCCRLMSAHTSGQMGIFFPSFEYYFPLCGETNIRSAPLDINIRADFSNFDRSLFIVTSQISQIIQLSIILENPFGDWLWTIQSQSHIYVAEMAKRCLIEMENDRFTVWSFCFCFFCISSSNYCQEYTACPACASY